MKKTNTPITIGLPVYNGEKHLSEVLDCLLAQTYKNFELIISDNASTDSTPEICQKYAGRDPRIRYFRQQCNIGAARNFNHVASIARGKYFKWASANDICHPTMLEACNHALEENDDCVLVYPSTRLIDDSGDAIRDYDDSLDATLEDPVERFKKVVGSIGLNNAANGLIRTEALLRTRLEGIYDGGDYRLIGELCLAGKFLRLPQRLFLRRVSPESSTIGSGPEEMLRFNLPERSPLGNSNSLRIWAGYVSAVRRSNTDLYSKAQLYSFLLRVLRWSLPRIAKESMEEVRILWHTLKPSKNRQE